jgi:D-alanine transaminase
MPMPETIYLNNQFLPAEEAVISPLDRGFYFADGVYEVIKYYGGRPFRFGDHIDRLKNSLAGVRINFADLTSLEGLFNQLLLNNGLNNADAGVYLQITRGAATRVHNFPKGDIRPTVYARVFPMPSATDQQQNGIKVISREDIRWLRCNIKSIALLPNTLMYEEATEEGAGECAFVRNGFFTEASHSNILFVINGDVFTHPDGNFILPGITKKAVIEICRSSGIQVHERPVAYSETHAFDECFITGTGSEVMPVVQINDDFVGDGKPGRITQLIQEEFFKKVKN